MSSVLSARHRISVVDDDVHVQRAVKRAAEAAGFEVAQAFDGAPGLAMAQADRFDLIVLDVNMPSMDGRDVLSKLKQDPASASIPILVYSGRAGQLDRLEALKLGADDYIDKPFQPGFLVTMIARMIRKRAESVAKSV